MVVLNALTPTEDKSDESVRNYRRNLIWSLFTELGEKIYWNWQLVMGACMKIVIMMMVF